MAYGLKYYKELTQPNGKVVRLEILEKGYEGASKEIGPVCQALRLDIQGDTEIDAPIVKTSLSMTFVDAPDHVDARTKKCGNWDEFYTSDATLWRVVLKARNAQETAFTTMWGGYITPDSYTEVLQYRGSVTLVARDNIGHLSDFPFDAEGNADGMISLIELIREAWDKIESPMTLDDQAVANADWMLSDGVYAYDTYMNVSAFEDMNWYDALESALYAYGLVLRYTGNNNVSFYSLRNLPRMGAHEVEDISFIEPTFMSGAERELTPAVKRIEEAVDYEIVEQKAAPMGESVTFTGASSTIPFESMNVFGEKEWKDIPTWPIDNTTNEGWGNDKNKTLFYSPKAYGYDSVVGGNELYLATNTDGSGSVWYGLHMQGKSFKFTLAFGQLIERVNVPLYLSPIIVKKVNVIVSASANGITSYLNAGGSWQTSEAVLSLSIDEETSAVTKVVPLGAFSLDETLVKVTIKNVSLGARAGEEWWDVSRGKGIYVAINALTFADNNGEALCETNRVNTNYDAKNNIILSRDPKIAPALNDVLFPSIIKNGIFVKEGRTYNPAKTWYWGGQTPQQMAVYNHLQLLCYHAKPNNILRGTIVNADVADMQVIWMWHGAEHMLVSGTLDLISGYIENAVLREFARYEDMWGMLEPADMPEVEGKSSTNVEGGATASNEGTRMTSTTTVNIGGGGGSIVLDTFMSDTSQNGVQNRVIKAYVDDSCSDLDTRLQAEEGVTETYKTWWADLKKYIKVEGGNVKIDTNLIVEGDTSSGGSGQDTPASGTVTGIKVGPMSTDILTPNNAGIIDMVSVLSSIDVSDQLKDYAKLTDITKSRIDSVLGSTTAGNANRFLMSTGSTSVWASISKTNVTDALGYTPLSTGGGTISSGYANSLTLKITNGKAVYLTFSQGGEDKAYVGYNADLGTFLQGPSGSLILTSSGATLYNNNLLHSGNYATEIGDYYLKSSGGTISGDTDALKIVRNTNGYSAITYYNTQNGATTLLGVMGFDSNGEPSAYRASDNAWRTLIHSGNIGSYKAGDADKLDGINSTGFALIGGYPTTSTNNWNIQSGIYQTYAGTSDLPLNGVGNHVIHCNWDANAANQLFLAYSKDLFSFRRKSGNVWQDWKQIAFTDSTVAAAQKLVDASTGVTRISVDTNSYIYLTSRIHWGDGDWYSIGSYTETSGVPPFGRYIFYSGHIFKTASGEALRINSSGNVTIGGSDLAGTNYKLYVDGAINTTGTIYLYGGYLSLRPATKVYGDIEMTSSCMRFQAMHDGVAYLPILLNPNGGYVGIGTARPAYKLDVNGTGNFSVGVKANEVLLGGAGLYKGSYWTSALSDNDMVISGGKISLTGAVTMSSTLSVATSVTTPLLKSSGGLDIVANNSAAGSKLFLTTNCFRPWGDDAGLIDLGASNVQWRNVYAVNAVFSGDTSSGSDIRFKDIIKNKTIKIEHIAKAPLFTFKWNDREDDSIHLGSSAQYWEKVTPWLVKGEDFKTLDYSTLGVAMGISLAKKAVNHEERIKVLEKEIKRLKEEMIHG